MREVPLQYQGNDYEAGDQEYNEDIDEGRYSEEDHQPDSEQAAQDSNEAPDWQEGDLD